MLVWQSSCSLLSLGLQARLLADGARAEPLIGIPNSCLNPIRTYKEG
jgi:hypothetical protein